MAVTNFGESQDGGNYICRITDHVSYEEYDLIFNAYWPEAGSTQEFTDWINDTLPTLEIDPGDGSNYTGWEIADQTTLDMILSLYVSARWGDPGVDITANEGGYPFDRIRKGDHNLNYWRDSEDQYGHTPWESQGFDIGPDQFTLEDIPAPYKDGSSNSSIGLKAKDIDDAYLGQWDIGSRNTSTTHNNKFDPLKFSSTLSQGRNLFSFADNNKIRFWLNKYNPEQTIESYQYAYSMAGTSVTGITQNTTTPAYYAHLIFNDHTNEGDRIRLVDASVDQDTMGTWVVPLIRKANIKKIYDKSNIEYASNHSAEHTALSNNHNETKYIAAMVAGNLGFDTTTPQGYDLSNTSWKINDGNYKIPSSVEENFPCRASGSKNVSLAALARKTYHIKEACNNLESSFGRGINLFINENNFSFTSKITMAIFKTLHGSTTLNPGGLVRTPDNLAAAQFNNPSDVNGDTSNFSSAGPFRMSDFRGVGHRGVGYEVSSELKDALGLALPPLVLGTRPSFPGSENLASQNGFPSAEHTPGKMNYGLIVKQTGQLHLGGDPTEVSGSTIIRIDVNDNSDHFLETERDGPTSIKRPTYIHNSDGSLIGIGYDSDPLYTVNKTQYLISYKDYINNGKVNRDDYLDHHEDYFYIPD